MSIQPRTPNSACVVCNETVTVDFEAWCMRCGSAFHLQLRQDVPGKDCGDVWLDEETLGLDFCCRTCLDIAAGVQAVAFEDEPVGLDDVLDLGEGATVLGWSEERLEQAAGSGQVKHRRTAGGILLFMRRDLLALSGDLP